MSQQGRWIPSLRPRALLDVFEDNINTMGQTILMVTHSTLQQRVKACSSSGRVLYNQIFPREKRASDVPRNLGYSDDHGKVVE